MVVPLGVDFDDLRRDPGAGEALRKELGIGGGEMVVGIVGRITSIKNHELFLRVAVRARDLARFVVYGDGGDRDNLEMLVQAYFWRWDIEVNHRDEKQLIGVGHAQVRAAKSAERVPAFAVACYSMLLISAARAFGLAAAEPLVDRPKWLTQSSRKPVRLSTNQLLRRLKLERRDAPIDLPNFDHFEAHVARTMKLPKSKISLDQALQYAFN